ncbi:MAG: aminopeptidase N [Gammaproteobacteria bacterium]
MNIQTEQLTTYLKDYAPTNYLIDTVALEFHLHEKFTRVMACLTIRRNPAVEQVTADALPPLTLVGDLSLDLLKLSIDGEKLTKKQYKLDKGLLTIPVSAEQFELETLVEIKPQENTALSGLYKSAGNFCTQCESQGFRRITYFLDQPDILARYTVTIDADKTRYPILLSNGNLVAEGDMADNRHWVRYVDPFPKPSYLFALVAGDLEKTSDTFKTMSGKSVDLHVFTEKGNSDKAKHAITCLQQSMKWDEQAFGREYDLEVYNIVAVSFFNMGAMENKSLNIFNSQYILVKPETATDNDYHSVLVVVGHEYFHNWSGNRVTCRDWFQLSLKEGLTVFREQQFTESLSSPAVERIVEAKNMRIRQFSEDSGPLSHPVQPQSYEKIDNFYTMTVYHKGAAIITMLQTLLGKEVFRQGMDRYFSANDGKAVTIYDLVDAMAEVYGEDLTQFKRWYTQSGTPELTFTGEYLQDKKQFVLSVTQETAPTHDQKEKLPLHMPIPVALYSKEGKEIYPEKILVLKEKSQQYTFDNIDAQPIPSLFRHFSAPVKYQYPYSPSDYITLITKDTDGFNRWDAMQQYVSRELLTAIRDDENNLEHSFDSVISLFSTLFEENLEDKLFYSELLTLPSESYLSELQKIIAVEATYSVRKVILQKISQKFYSKILSLYKENNLSVPYQYSLKEHGRRALKNKMLSYLSISEKEEIVSLCLEQFRHSDNMTDVIAALGCLVNIDCEEKVLCLDEFYHRWEDDPLVIDKWFSLQASADDPLVRKKVKDLLSHKAFDYKNPNRVRSLLGPFIGANAYYFHEATGQGYAFLGDQIMKLDDINPQITARLVVPLTQWKRYDEQRQIKMQEQLQRIIKKKHLSADVREVVSKSLSDDDH